MSLELFILLLTAAIVCAYLLDSLRQIRAIKKELTLHDRATKIIELDNPVPTIEKE